jgi:plastocyanin
MKSTAVIVALAIGTQLLTACSDMSAPSSTVRIAARDQCDPASFNAALGAGTCKGNGNVTFNAFNDELTAQHSVAAWQFSPTALTARVGESIVVTNEGGEEHTFTEVEEFGGGIVESLNQASGNTTEAPECAQLAAGDFIEAGATKTEEAETAVGTERYQCCIHPWMRATVTVTSR